MIADSPRADAPAPPAEARVASRTFTWLVLAASTWLLGGACLDGWAHRNLANLETFFTPWHAVLYSGEAACLAVLAAYWFRGMRSEASYRHALPGGYGLSLIGALAFGASGALDMIWHLVFGIERATSALFSPTHLALMASATMIFAGPLRAAWHSPARRLPYTGVLSATLVLSMMTFFLQFDHPYIAQWSTGYPPTFDVQDSQEALGALPIILLGALLAGLFLLLVTRFDLPRGAATIILGLNAVFVTSIIGFDRIILLITVAGVVGDVLLAVLRPSAARVMQTRVFAFLLPVSLFTLYFVGLILADGIWWTVHMWTGTVVVTGLVGVLLSYLVLPPSSHRTAAATTGS